MTTPASNISATSPILPDQDSAKTIEHHIPELDGLRAIAILIVVLSHTGVWPFPGHGAAGVWIFFALSGYLLTRQVLIRGFWSPRLILAFYIKRFFRIIPSFIFVIFFSMLVFKNDLDSFLMTISFRYEDTGNYLWAVRQELLFYIILPILLAPLSLKRSNLGKVSAIFLIAYLLASNLIVTATAGLPVSLRITHYVSVFLFGVLTALLMTENFYTFRSHKSYNTLNFISISLLVFFCCFNRDVATLLLGADSPLVTNYSWKNVDFFGVMSCLIIAFSHHFVFENEKELFLLSILRNKFLRLVGKYSYGIYLIHMPLIPVFVKWTQNTSLLNMPVEDNAFLNVSRFLTPMIIFLLTSLFSTVLAVLLHAFIEQPSVRFGRLMILKLGLK
ncbi:acyltransferase family protein [Leptolyngbya iicbica]|uniref:Acyltransferase n=2 Tax=Cyanophyceae TaxID=3028117 RepID=A0A4Q7E8P1_9CYAN|nr:acyltransferase [Leptolyngbya sp. LK]RZM78881.1 acyltransferase [Leptolyngbya sp. LK]